MQSEQEIRQAASDWANNHCPPALKTATGGLNPKDAQLIGEFIQANHAGVWSVHTITDAVNKLQSQLTWRSKSEIAYDIEYAKLSPEQAGIFGSWWQSSDAKNSIVRDGDFGFENGAKILSWMAGKTFSQSGFNLAVSNLVGTVGLHLAAAREQGEKRGHEMEPGESFMKKEPAKPEYVGGRKNHSLNMPKPAQPKPDTTRDAWSAIIENQLRDGTHAQQAASKELHTRLSADGMSPRQISAELQKLQRSYKRLFSAKAV
jgi:hypothetical protein